MNYIYLVFILIIIGLVGWIIFLYSENKRLKRKNETITKEKEEIERLGAGLSEYNKKIQERKEKQKIKIIELLKKQQKITNNDVEKLLSVSDATATRYLDELEKEEKIQAFGKSRKGTFYRLKPD